jgi:23S rRNA pseudouridine2605 synthase
MALERLQKVLARAGVASRRRAEELIVQGRINVDGRAVTELGSRVDPRKQRIEVDGRRVEPEPYVYIVLHKPRGVVATMRDPEGRPTVAQLVRSPVRAVPVGRLDFHTSGVLLLTNDGDFAAVLAHPSKGADKVYIAKVSGVMDDAAVERFARPVEVDGKRTRPAQVKRLRTVDGKTWLEIRIKEGRNRQIRRMGEVAGFPVMRLARLSFGGIDAEGLRPGMWRYLTRDELVDLRARHGVPKRIVSPPKTPAPKTPPRRPLASKGTKGSKAAGSRAGKTTARRKTRRR